LPVGAYGLLASIPWWSWKDRLAALDALGEGGVPLYGTLWSYMNGMESGLVLFFVGLTAWWLCLGGGYATTRAAAIFGLLLAGIILSRLDHVFFPAAILVVLGLQRLLNRDWPALGRLVVAGLACALPVLVYLLFNFVVFDS